MAVKQIQAAVWTLATSYDGRRYSEFPAGDKPSLPSLLLYTDITAGPTTGGENDAGTYLRLFGTNFGGFSDWGNTSHVYIGGVEVANYRYLRNAVGLVGTLLGIQELCVQVGAIGAPTPGTPLNITMSVRGASPVNPTSLGALLDLDGFALSFTPQPGPIVFVSLSGNDASAGTIAAPLRHLQTYNGSSQFGGAIYGPVSGGTTANQVSPGTHVIIRGGEYGADKSFGNRWCDFFRRTGTAPSGAAGQGPIAIMPYPGSIGGNAPEVVTWNGDDTSAGGFNFADTARSGETTPWGTLGYCKHIAISSLLVHASPLQGGDAAPIEHQTAADYARVVNCDLAWPCSVGGPTSAGIGGKGSWRRLLGNDIHDIADPSGAQQNHAIYVGNNTGASGAAMCDYHSIIAYNVMKDISGGSCINGRGVVAGAPADSAPYLSIHHNWFQNPVKHAVNLFDGRARANVWANVMLDIQQSPFFCNSDNVSTVGGIYFGHNTCVGWGTFTGGSYPAVYFNGGANTGSVRVENNVFFCKAGTPSPAFDRFYSSTNGLNATFAGNYWHDATGIGTKPAGDTTGTQANPQLVNITTDLRPAAGSTIPNDAVSITSINGTLYPFDLAFIARPQGSNTNWTVGAFERAGG